MLHTTAKKLIMMFHTHLFRSSSHTDTISGYGLDDIRFLSLYHTDEILFSAYYSLTRRWNCYIWAINILHTNMSMGLQFYMLNVWDVGNTQS